MIQIRLISRNGDGDVLGPLSLELVHPVLQRVEGGRARDVVHHDGRRGSAVVHRCGAKQRWED